MDHHFIPIESMYGISTYIYHKNQLFMQVLISAPRMVWDMIRIPKMIIEKMPSKRGKKTINTHYMRCFVGFFLLWYHPKRSSQQPLKSSCQGLGFRPGPLLAQCLWTAAHGHFTDWKPSCTALHRRESKIHHKKKGSWKGCKGMCVFYWYFLMDFDIFGTLACILVLFYSSTILILLCMLAEVFVVFFALKIDQKIWHGF